MLKTTEWLKAISVYEKATGLFRETTEWLKATSVYERLKATSVYEWLKATSVKTIEMDIIPDG